MHTHVFPGFYFILNFTCTHTQVIRNSYRDETYTLKSLEIAPDQIRYNQDQIKYEEH